MKKEIFSLRKYPLKLVVIESHYNKQIGNLLIAAKIVSL